MVVSSRAATFIIHKSERTCLQTSHVHSRTCTANAPVADLLGRGCIFTVRVTTSNRFEFPGSLTQFQQPALPVRVEERVREVVAVVLGDLKRLVLDAIVQILQ